MTDTDILSALLGQLSSAKDERSDGGEAAPAPEESLFGDIDAETIIKLMDAFSRLNESDKDTELLLALKPHLRGENRGKVDKAVRLMKLMSVFSLFKDSGLVEKML